MLTECPECGLQVSDRALSCPHCGYPMKKEAKRTKKRMRLPNGFGRIVEIKSKNLRKPFRAMVTTGFDELGRPIGKILKPEGYFETYNEAYEALVEYHKNPYDLEADITVEELYKRWSDGYFQKVKSASSIRTITAAWAYCSSVYKMRAKDLRPRHIRACMENGTANINGKEKSASPNIQGRIKSMFNLMLDYAVEYEIAQTNYARSFSVDDSVVEAKEKNKREHVSFTEDELKTLWENINEVEYADVILINCYSGWRPQELCLLELKNINLENWTFKGGMKTDAGIDRVAPIHPLIRDLVKRKYQEAKEFGSEYLINATDRLAHHPGKQLTYDMYRKRFQKVVDRLNLNPDHRAHDPRKTFITLAKKYKVDEYAIKYIVGHAINDITEKVYTERDIDWLQEEIAKISVY